MMKEVNMAESAASVQSRLDAVVETVVMIAEREERIARELRRRVAVGEFPAEYAERGRARADSLMRLAADLRKAVGAGVGRRW